MLTPRQVRLGDTDLLIEVEKDHTVYGDECKFGGGKTLREGMGQASGVGADDALDLVITNALSIVGCPRARACGPTRTLALDANGRHPVQRPRCNRPPCNRRVTTAHESQ